MFLLEWLWGGHCDIIKETMDRERSQSIVEVHLFSSMEQVELEAGWIFQQNNNMKHSVFCQE